jgi:hypothetical protein
MRWRILLSSLLAGGSLLASGIAAAPANAPRRLDFTVLRNGEAVGHNRIELARDGEDLTVSVETEVVVRIAFVPVYRFEHSGTESWRAGQLVRLSSTTNDDGTKHSLEVMSQGGRLHIECDGSASDIEAGLMPASLWNDGLVRQAALLNTIDGTRMPITVKRLGQEPVEVSHSTVTAEHYRIAGALSRELWYSQAGELVRVAFAGPDGSEIAYVLR